MVELFVFGGLVAAGLAVAAVLGFVFFLIKLAFWLVLLPFRLLRPDPEIDFLSFALADAVSASLAGLPSVVIRSSASVARFASETPDLKALASQADVDHALTGTLLRAGDQLRVTTQLVEAPAGTLVASQTLQSSMGDVFRLLDEANQLSAIFARSRLTSMEGMKHRKESREHPDARVYFKRV